MYKTPHIYSGSFIIFLILLALKFQLSVRKMNLVNEDKIMKILVKYLGSKRERLLDKIQLLTALKRTEECGNITLEYLLQNELSWSSLQYF